MDSTPLAAPDTQWIAGRALARYQELTQKQAVRESNRRRGQIAYQEGLTQLSGKRLDEASRSS